MHKVQKLEWRQLCKPLCSKNAHRKKLEMHASWKSCMPKMQSLLTARQLKLACSTRCETLRC